MKLRIGYDAKRIFQNRTGLGNFGRSLIQILVNEAPSHSYHLFHPKPAKVSFSISSNQVQEHLPQHWIWKKLSSLWRQGPIRRQIEQEKIQLYHGLSGELPKGLGIPTIVSVHDLIFIKHPELYSPIDVWIHKQKVKYAVGTATKIVAISQETKNDIVEYLAVDPAKIEVIYQGCDPQFSKVLLQDQKQQVLDKYGLPSKFILNVGTLETRKNAKLILQALKETTDTIVLVGKRTAYTDELEDYIQRNQMQDRVYLIHTIEFSELPALYQSAEIFCYPSFSEGFGIPILEALSSGTPVITTQGGCMQEAGGPHSVYINPLHPDELRAAVKNIQQDSKLRDQMIVQGREHMTQFSDRVIAKRWLKLYKDILS